MEKVGGREQGEGVGSSGVTGTCFPRPVITLRQITKSPCAHKGCHSAALCQHAPGYVTWGKSLSFSEPQFTQLQNGMNKRVNAHIVLTVGQAPLERCPSVNSFGSHGNNPWRQVCLLVPNHRTAARRE